jgi:hypothetical protein
MEAKAGDRVALDGKKVGQAKRTGVIKQVSKGLSGLRYNVVWDDGTNSIISPHLGNLTVQAGRGNSKKKSKPKAKVAKASKVKAKPAKAKAKKKAKR